MALSTWAVYIGSKGWDWILLEFYGPHTTRVWTPRSTSYRDGGQMATWVGSLCVCWGIHRQGLCGVGRGAQGGSALWEGRDPVGDGSSVKREGCLESLCVGGVQKVAWALWGRWGNYKEARVLWRRTECRRGSVGARRGKGQDHKKTSHCLQNWWLILRMAINIRLVGDSRDPCL